MTYADAPQSPMQGIAATPVTLTANTLATIPQPKLAPGALPWTTGWIVILNSSPFTLLVASGGAQVTQIAAFTSDKVLVSATGATAVTLLPVPGSGTSVIGVQDSTAYATWYQDEPDGQYPAALGSGAAQFQVSADLDSGAGLTALANSTTQLPSSSTFYSAAQYAGLTIAFNNFDGGGASLPLAVFVRWANSAGTRYVGSRYFVVPGGTGGALDGWAEVTFQHKGAKFQVWIINGTGTNISYSFAMTQTTVARDSWTLGQLRQNAGVSPYTYPLFSGATAVVAFGTTVTLATAKGTWAGPAVWNYFFAGGTNATFFLQVQDVSGTWQTLVFKQITAAPPTNQVNAPITETVILPPHPVRVAFQNGQGAGNLSPITSLTPDEDRM